MVVLLYGSKTMVVKVDQTKRQDKISSEQLDVQHCLIMIRSYDKDELPEQMLFGELLTNSPIQGSKFQW